MKRISGIFMSLVFLLSAALPTFGCDKQQSDTYVLQIIFGDQALKYESDETFDLLLDALYLCSEQADNSGAEEWKALKNNKIGHLPSIGAINVKLDSLSECSHTAWEEEYLADAEVKNLRKKILQNTVNKVFDFGFIKHLFYRGKGKCDSFSALLYYSHILADYLADDPDKTAITVGNTHVPPYSGQASVEVDGNKPSFFAAQKNSIESLAEFSQLDSRGRAGVAFADIGTNDLTSAGSRADIGNVKPSGWNQNKYEGLVNSNPHIYTTDAI